MKQVRVLKVVVASPNDVRAERDAFPAIVDELNKGIADERGLRLEVYRWETDAYPSFHPLGPQGQIDSCLRIEDCDLLIAIFWKRFGTAVHDVQSGTEHEIRLALESCEKMGRPQLMIYFNQAPHEPQSQAEKEQWKRVLNFKQSLSQKVLWWEYRGKDKIRDLVRQHLTQFIRQHVPTFETDLWLARPKRRDFYQYVSLPVNYVVREDLLIELREALLGNSNTIAITSAIKTKPTALHGMGGIGKSVMARALCEDPQVQATFPDGILWVTLGKEPKLTEQMRLWIHALGGVISETAPTEEQLKANLAKLLAERTCLLIVDDVWYRRHAEAFRIGSRCRLLLTTRDEQLALELGAEVQPVPLMALAEAVRLLEEWANFKLQNVAQEQKIQIVKRLGYLPLAIRLAGAQLQRKFAHEWLNKFDVHQLRSKRFEDVHDSLEKTFELSLEELSAEERRLYLSLAIFKEDEHIPELAIQKLWRALARYDDEQTANLMEDLAARALLSLEREGSKRRAGFHDLMRELIAAELGEDGQRIAHTALLEAYRQTSKGQDWYTTPDDGYLYDHLGYHLAGAQQQDELHELFKDQHWMHSRVPQRKYEYDGYLEDLTAAWNIAYDEARRQITSDERPSALATCVRYALIRTSVNSIASNYEPVLVARAVELGLWNTSRALSIVAKAPDDEQRARLCVALLATGRLDQNLQELAKELGLNAARVVEDEESRTEVLSALALQFTGEVREEVLREALAAAMGIEDEGDRTRMLGALAIQLTGKGSEQALQEAFAVATALEDEDDRTRTLEALALQLKGSGDGETLREALAVATAIAKEWSRAEVISALAPHLTEESLQDVLAVARAITDERSRAKVLVVLVARLTGNIHEQVLQEALAAATAISKEWARAEALSELAPRLTGESLQKALVAAKAIADEVSRAEALSALAPRLTGKSLLETLVVARAIADEWSRANVLIALAPQLTGESLQEALTVARTIISIDRERALAALAPQLTGESRERALQEALTVGRAINGDDDRECSLTAPTPQSIGESLEEALVTARVIKDEYNMARAIAALSASLTGEVREQALHEALATTRVIVDEESRAQVLATMAPQLKGESLHEALSAAKAIRGDESRAQVFAALGPQLIGESLQEVLAAARAIKDVESRAQVLAVLTVQLKGRAREHVLQEALAAARMIFWSERSFAEVLSALAPSLTGKSLNEALAAAKTMKEYDARVLSALAPQLTGESLEEALAAARAIRGEESRAQVLAALAPRLMGEFRDQALREALAAATAIKYERARARALTTLAPQLTGEVREQALQEALAAVWGIKDEGTRARVLATLAPLLKAEICEQALQKVLDAARVNENKWSRMEVLAALAPLLPHNVIREALLEFIAHSLNKERLEILKLCSYEKLFTHPILAHEILEAITLHIIEICQKWEWL